MSYQISRIHTEKTSKGFENIFIKGARTHNLKNIDAEIPHNQLVVVTGVSGSGKSSLTIDTLYAEGQRRYVESLSSYARQFLTRMNKPDVDFIHGLRPAIAIEQRISTRSPRSTVGSMTEITDYLRLLFARIGKTISPVSGQEVKKHDVTDVVNYVSSFKIGQPVTIAFPFQTIHGRTEQVELELLMQKGFTRLQLNGELKKIEDYLSESKQGKSKTSKKINIVVDRLQWQSNPETQSRLADSVQISFYESEGYCLVQSEGGERQFSNRFELDGIVFEQPTPEFFSFNNPFGACKTCEGFGSVIGIDEDLVVPDKTKSVYDEAVVCWRGEKMSEWRDEFVKQSVKFNFPVHRSYQDLNKKEKNVLWNGNEFVHGIHEFFKWVETQTYKIQYRVMLARYRGKTICPECGGSRSRPDAQFVKVSGLCIGEMCAMPIKELTDFFQKIALPDYETKIAARLVAEIQLRLQLMVDVGLNYLNLNRLSATLSGGETQRIHLTRTLGSNLTSSLYILDEPSAGLHARDVNRLVKVLHQLRNLGNTVVVVEHEEAIMRAADHIIDLGPLAGTRGGEIIATGHWKQLETNAHSLTGQYLNGRQSIPLPSQRRKWINSIRLQGAAENNLKSIDVTIPLNVITAVTGISGSGKSTLIRKIVYPLLQKQVGGFGDKPGRYSSLQFDPKWIYQVELIDQNPLGKSSRSNPVTYTKAYDSIRDLFAAQRSAFLNGFKAKHFSFNVDGGRCDTCKGEGEIVVEMQFLADVHLVCNTCNGKRFNEDVLQVTYHNKNIHEVLELTVDEAMEFFWEEDKIVALIKPLQDVGLGYIKLGQASSTLSGGEAQRVKLASFLGKGNISKPVLFIFDEPTTGLHFHDIHNLMKSFDMLIENGHSVIVMEHNLEVIKCADYIIDLGPEGGEKGGYLLFQGTPEELVKNKHSYTAQFLTPKLRQSVSA
jgi:excinuclease ABC subunit A